MTDQSISGYLYDTADRAPTTEPQMYADKMGTITGVAMPSSGRGANLTAGSIITAEYARQLGAQLILAADEHDAFIDAVHERAVRADQQRVQRTTRDLGGPRITREVK